MIVNQQSMTLEHKMKKEDEFLKYVNNPAVELLSLSCRYFSPNIVSVTCKGNEIIFKTCRYVCGDSVNAETIFHRDTHKVKKVSPYESLFIK